ncbi:hypothetical protein C0995_004371, partial [Termitomyces sp. Mi166
GAVEDEKDLVILEDIDRPIPPSSGSPYTNPQEQTFLHVAQPKTAQREPRKDLYGDARKRAVLKAERDKRKREEKMEEMEVLDAVADLDVRMIDGKERHSEIWEHQHKQGDYADMDVEMDVDIEEPLSDGSDDEHQDKKKQEPKQKLKWRKSFER